MYIYVCICHQRQEAETEDAPAGPASGDAGGASYDPAAAPSEASAAQSEEPPSKRQRVAAEPTAAAAAAAAGLVLVTVCCVEGGGLEQQEAQVEVDGGLTAAQLKQSLIEAGIGPEGMRARNLQLADADSGAPILVSGTLAAASSGVGADASGRRCCPENACKNARALFRGPAVAYRTTLRCAPSV